MPAEDQRDREPPEQDAVLASREAISGRARVRVATAREGARGRRRDVPPGDGARPRETTPPSGRDGAPGDARSVPSAVKEAASWSWRLLLIGTVVYFVARGLTAVPVVTVPFVVALLLTAVLGPVQRWLRDRCRVPHSLAAFLALLVGIVIIGAIVWFVVAQITTNAPRMAEQLVQFAERTNEWLRTGPLQVSDAQVTRYGEEITATLRQHQGQLLSGAWTTLATLTELVGGALLLLLATFFLLRDGHLIWGWALSLLPFPSRARIDHVGRFGWHTLGGFMRGQTIIAALHASTIFVVLVSLHVPMPVALAVLVFVGSYIPMLGMTVAGAFCIIVSLIEHGPGAALAVGVTIIVLIQLEAHLLQPLIMARTVEVHPLGIAMAVLAGATLGGIAGALFAVPLVAFLNAAARAVHHPLEPAAAQGRAP